MSVFEYELNNQIYIPKYIYSELYNKNICFFDIETTGLSSKYCNVILVGLLCIEGERVYIKQFFADHPDEEYELLSQFINFLNNFEYIISYNGKSFDIPFLKYRLKSHSIHSNISDIPHLDLLQVVRKNKKLLGLDNCKLKTVEKSLNIYREDTISGKESVDLYKAYTYSKDINKRQIVLKHNYDDILYLPELLSIYDIIERNSLLTIDTKFKQINLNLIISKNSIEFQQNMLSIIGNSTVVDIPFQVYYRELYSLNWSTTKGMFELQIFYKSARLSDGSKCLYLDLLDDHMSLDGFDNLNYSIPNNIVLIKVNELIIYNNISLIISKIISQLD